MDKMLERILEEAKKKGIQKQEICQACGIDQCNFAGWVNGRTSSYKKYAPEIAKLLGVSVEYLVSGSESEAEAFYRRFKALPKSFQDIILDVMEKGDA